MKGYVPELVEKVSGSGEIIVLMMDQSKVGEGFEVLMVSIRVGDRALPILWCVKETKGPIGFDTQEELLNQVFELFPEDLEIVLMADRFYGTSSLVSWCQDHRWGYRIRLKGNLHFDHQGGLIVSGQCLKMGLTEIENAQFNNTDVSTNIGIVHEPGHKEPWIIAMDCNPSEYTTLDYGMRWGIEAMFSDFKSRGFSITDTHLSHCDRIERLILIMTIALFWATSTGIYDELSAKKNSQRNPINPNPDRLFHGLHVGSVSF